MNRGRRTTMIAVKGDRRYTAAMWLLAATRRTTVAALVRESLDAMYADDLEPILRTMPDHPTREQLIDMRKRRRISETWRRRRARKESE